jgi:hypothetical protein
LVHQQDDRPNNRSDMVAEKIGSLGRFAVT